MPGNGNNYTLGASINKNVITALTLPAIAAQTEFFKVSDYA